MNGLDRLRERLAADPPSYTLTTPSGDRLTLVKRQVAAFVYHGRPRSGVVTGFYRKAGQLAGVSVVEDGRPRRFAFSEIELVHPA